VDEPPESALPTISTFISPPAPRRCILNVVPASAVFLRSSIAASTCPKGAIRLTSQTRSPDAQSAGARRGEGPLSRASASAERFAQAAKAIGAAPWRQSLNWSSSSAGRIIHSRSLTTVWRCAGELVISQTTAPSTAARSNRLKSRDRIRRSVLDHLTTAPSGAALPGLTPLP
jgi:hypothetical protein